MKTYSHDEFTNLKQSRQAQLVAGLYLAKCTTVKPYVNGKPSTDFWRVYKFCMTKTKSNEMWNCYSYLEKMKKQELLSLTELFDNIHNVEHDKFIHYNSPNKSAAYKRKNVMDWIAE